MIVQTVAIIIMIIALVACSGSQVASPSAPTQTVVEVVTATRAVPAVEETFLSENVVVADTTATTEATVAPAAEEPTPSAEIQGMVTIVPSPEKPAANNDDEMVFDPEEMATGIEPIQVTYFTPPQTEGPYYPVAKLSDRDNDLTVLEGAAGSVAGQIVEFGGTVYDASGIPVEGVTIEIWQTDGNGIYLHPGDPQTEQRDRNFQFYGEAITSADGSYSFRTILPGQYEPRPRHIHAKVKAGQQELLTTQIYFDGDPSLEADGIFLGGRNENVHLVMTLAAGQDGDGNPILVGEYDIILNTTLSAN